MKYLKNKIIIVIILIILCFLIGLLHYLGATWVNIVSSILAAVLVILLNIIVDRFFYKEDEIDKWGIANVYETRAQKNEDSDPDLDKARYRVDGIAFGLSSFRNKNNERVKHCLERGVNFRLLVMHPNSPFVEAREDEENVQHGHIKKTINDLVTWANDLNSRGYKGKIEVRGYSCMTLDFYWRIDNTAYMGPYWYGRQSQVTITYKFTDSGKCFSTYAQYFEDLWDDKSVKVLTSAHA